MGEIGRNYANDYFTIEKRAKEKKPRKKDLGSRKCKLREGAEI